MSAELFQFPDRDRREIERCLEQIRATGWAVHIVEDFGTHVVVECFDASEPAWSERWQMIINPAAHRLWRVQQEQ